MQLAQTHMLSPIAASAPWIKHRHWVGRGAADNGKSHGIAKALYIDNFATLVFSQAEADVLCDNMVMELARYGIVASIEDRGESEFIGFELYKHQMWRPSRPKFWRLVYALEHIVMIGLL